MESSHESKPVLALSSKPILKIVQRMHLIMLLSLSQHSEVYSRQMMLVRCLVVVSFINSDSMRGEKLFIHCKTKTPTCVFHQVFAT